MSAMFPMAKLHNHLLDSLPSHVCNRLRPHLEIVLLSRGQIIQKSGGVLHYAYFPIDALLVNLALSESGVGTEVSTVGSEGFVGTGFFMGRETSFKQTVVLSSGRAYRIKGNWIKEEFDRHGEMMMLLLRYTQILLTQTAQSAMCKRYHSIDQQFSRMLLQALDRLPGNELIVTQETIASLLGVRRESITDAASRMKQLKLIDYCRGKIRICNHSGLKKYCCECYFVVKNEIDRLLPYTANIWRQQDALAEA